MRFFIGTVAFLAFTIMMFIFGAIISSPTIMLSVVCIMLPAAFWLNGYAVSKVGLRIAVESTPAVPAASARQPQRPAAQRPAPAQEYT